MSDDEVPFPPELLIEFAAACEAFDAASFAEARARSELARLVNATDEARTRKLRASNELERAARKAVGESG